MSKKVVIVTATTSKNHEEFVRKPIYKSLEKLHKNYSSNEFDFEICGISCDPDIYPSNAGHIVQEGDNAVLTNQDNSHLIYRI